MFAGYLFADPFRVIGAAVPQAAPQWGLFETTPAAAREKALVWQRACERSRMIVALPTGPAAKEL
ncbi:hypothetical protein [Streptomyces sp. 2114.4]|uniref:hypothetical protein n=1 Tax=Streptomyces sp. 2114.4 TaxID=1938836 RepID=UPI00211AD997|nr:hypothetical protein [Streptomyces sp. 2114.4]